MASRRKTKRDEKRTSSRRGGGKKGAKIHLFGTELEHYTTIRRVPLPELVRETARFIDKGAFPWRCAKAVLWWSR